MNANDLFTKWALGFSGCDGGDISNKSIWVCGIEYGIDITNKNNMKNIRGGFQEEIENITYPTAGREPSSSYPKWRTYPYNWRLLKLLAAIECGEWCVENYKTFDDAVQPFVKNKEGYFKMNLYPLQFRNTELEDWVSEYQEATGLPNGDAYRRWIRENRFPKIQAWATQYAHKLVICTGINWAEDFQAAFGYTGKLKEIQLNENNIGKRRLLMHGSNQQGTLLVVIPFLGGPNGLISNDSIHKYGKKIRELLDGGEQVGASKPGRDN